MKKIVFGLGILVTIATNAIAGQQPDSVKIFIDKALTTMQENSAFAKKVNWDDIRARVNQMSENASTYAEAAPAIKYAFDALNDKHGWLVFAEEEYHNPKFQGKKSRLSENMKQAALKGAQLYSGTVNNKYAYISIPFFGGQKADQINSFAQRIQDSLFSVINETTEGIIIDLRLNGGGNMYPMFAGLSNVLGDDDISILADSTGKIIERSFIRKNDFIQDGRIAASLAKNYGDLSRMPVAVIIGPGTGSSGECLAAGFIGRKKTVLIGETTAGYTTANNGFLLAGEDYAMVLAVGYLTDRFGNTYYDNVTPDIEVTGDDFFNHANDQKIQAAVKWFESKK